MMGMPPRGRGGVTHRPAELPCLCVVPGGGRQLWFLQLPAATRLYIYFSERVIQQPAVFSGVLFFVFLFFSS